MGYLSHGKFALRKESYDQALILEIPLPQLLEDMTFVDFSDEWVYWEFDGFKMYDSYPDVAEFYLFIEQFETAEWDCDEILWAKGPIHMLREVLHYHTPDECFDYVEVGEEEGDITRKGDGGIFHTYTEIEVY